MMATNDDDVRAGGRQIGIAASDGASLRYPASYETRQGFFDAVPLPRADPASLALAIVDGSDDDAEILDSLPPGVPVLLGPTYGGSTGGWTAAGIERDWLPLTPWPHAAEIRALGDLAGEAGENVAHIVLSTGTGAPSDERWDCDQWWALDRNEAVLGAMMVGELLLGQDVVGTRRVAHQGGVEVLEHTFSDGRAVTQILADAALSGLPWLSIDMLTTRGRVCFNREFSPGTLSVWDAAQGGFRFPSVPLRKANIQAPDTAPGGWSMPALIDWTLDSDAQARADARAGAVRVAGIASTITS